MSDQESWPPPPPPAPTPPAPPAYPVPPATPYATPGTPQWWAPTPPAPKPPVAGVSWVVAAMMALLCAVLGGAVGGLIVRNHDGSGAGKVTAVTIGATAEPSGDAARSGNSVAAVASRILPSVVSIQVKVGSGGDTGSGIVLSSSGYVMTNNHVIAAARQGGQLSVILPDKSRVHASVVGEPDTVDDIAVIKLAGVSGLIPAALGNSDDLAVGDTVVAVGSPLGLAGTVTSGIVSALNRPVEAGGSPGVADDVIDAIQTDAAINPGNSGGPLVDDQGRVVGVNSAIASLSTASIASSQSGSIGLGFAIPVNEAKRIAEQIITRGFATHAIIGVRLDGSYTGEGAKVSSGVADPVTPGGPAAKAGIKAGDVIVAVNGERITTADELIVAIRRRVPGSTIELTYLRNGQRATVSVVLGSQRSS
ncbi:MAG TPA: trypsin-like peptidase domain-containing protein [Mycobacteriales bacterium]|nr:trypsin-like peptidase domain-containing protein [Mycobacteriales bacterium]